MYQILVYVCILLVQFSSIKLLHLRAIPVYFCCPSESMRLPPVTNLEQASTHKSAKTHAGIVFVTRDFYL